MAVSVKKAMLWRKELENRPGTLAEALKPLADAGISLQVVMGYAFAGEHEHAAVEVYPVSGAKAERAASEAGLEESPRIACLIVTGDDSPGLGHAIADALAGNGINISFVMVQVTGKQYHGVFGFESQAEADRAVPVIKQAGKASGARGRGARGRAAAGAGSRSGARSGGKLKVAAKRSSTGAKTGSMRGRGRAAAAGASKSASKNGRSSAGRSKAGSSTSRSGSSGGNGRSSASSNGKRSTTGGARKKTSTASSRRRGS